MTMTKEQAYQVWCPMTRMERGSVEHGMGGVSMDAACIADQCAMWRWIPGGPKNSAGAVHETTRGYCGLAGRPA